MVEEWIGNCIICNGRIYYVYKKGKIDSIRRECLEDCPNFNESEIEE